MKHLQWFLLSFCFLLINPTINAKPKGKKQASKKHKTEYVDDFALLDAAIERNQKKQANLSLACHTDNTKVTTTKHSKQEARSRIFKATLNRILQYRAQADRLILKYGPSHPAALAAITKHENAMRRADHNLQKGIGAKKAVNHTQLIDESRVTLASEMFKPESKE